MGYSFSLFGAGSCNVLIAEMAMKRGGSLVSAYNRPGTKTGKDVSEIAGWSSPTGVRVTDDVDAALVLNPDIAVFAMSDNFVGNSALYRQCLNAGVNVACIGCQSSYPDLIDASVATEINALAKANRVTFTGAGNQDGGRVWMARLVLAIASDIRSVRHFSVSAVNESGAGVAKLANVNRTVSDFEALHGTGAERKSSDYRILFEHAIRAAGLTPTTVTEHLEPIVTDRSMYCAGLGAEVEPGKVIGTRWVTEIHTAQNIPCRAESELKLLVDGQQEESGWEVRGETLFRTVQTGMNTKHTTCVQTANRLSDIIAAAPGIQRLDQLPAPKAVFPNAQD